MNAKAVSALVFILLFAAGMHALLTSDNSNANETPTVEVEIRGYLAEKGDSDPKAVPNGAISILKDGEGTNAISGSTDENGYFAITVTVPKDGKTRLWLRCDIEGYTIMTIPDNLTRDSESGYAYFDVTEDEKDDGICTLCGDDLSKAIYLDSAKIPLTFTVTGSDGKTLNEAEITLYRNNGGGDVKIISGFTDSSGNCRLSSNIETGTYLLEVKCNGYGTYSDNLEVHKGTSIIPITLQPKDMSVYFGLTLYHILMILGVTIGLVLVAIAYALCRRTWKGVDRNDEM